MKAYAFLNIEIPWIAWLVYRGEMASPFSIKEEVLSMWHAKYLIDKGQTGRRRDYFKRESEIEIIRKTLFPKKVSRLSGLYLFPDKETAMNAGRKWGDNFKEDHLEEIEVHEKAIVSKYDSNWITKYIGSSDLSWVNRYFSSEPCTDQPIWELLVEGRAFVLGTRVLKLAYETVKLEWPKTLGLLELSRIAVELQSDLGLIWPLIIRERNILRLKLYLNFRDATDPSFLEKLSKYNGPKNINDLNLSTDLVLPDLTEFCVEFPA